MKKEFSLLQLFSIIDGRLSTNMGDVYEMLNHICDYNLYTHHLPVAMKYVKLKQPDWLIDLALLINDIKVSIGTEEFVPLIEKIKLHNEVYNIPQLKDEFDTSDFEDYMINNSLFK